MFFEGEHLEIFFMEEFFNQNTFAERDAINLGDFWVEMVNVYGRMRRKGI
jgi:hypothetical protein